MADDNGKKRHKIDPSSGVKTQFTSDNQPPPEAKKAGWEELRSRRLLTQAIIKEMFGDDGVGTDSFKSYITSLITNAKMGNPKAIDAVNKGIEEEIIKVANVDAEGNSVESKSTEDLLKEMQLLSTLMNGSKP